MIVVDASVVIDVLLREPGMDDVAARLLAEEDGLAAPHLIDLEVAQVLRRRASSREMEAGRGREALLDLLDLSIIRYPHDVLLPRIWELRQNVTAYDAAYLALAEALEVPFLTRDSRLSSVPGHEVNVEVV